MVIPDCQWKPKYARATVAALGKSLWSRDFKEEVARCVESKGLKADPDGDFALMKTLSERYKIIDEERSRQRKEISDKQADPNSSEPHCRAELHAGAGQGPLNGVERSMPEVLECRRCGGRVAG